MIDFAASEYVKCIESRKGTTARLSFVLAAGGTGRFTAEEHAAFDDVPHIVLLIGRTHDSVVWC